MFDLAKLDILNPSEEGRVMVITHPLTGAPFRRADGAQVGITLRGRNSSIAKATLREIGDERAAIESSGRTITPEQAEEWNTKYLCAMTAAWNFDQLDGVEFPCNAANKDKLWRDPRFSWLRPRALGFIAEDGHFLGS